MDEHLIKIMQAQREHEREAGYPKYTEDGQPIFPEDEVYEPFETEQQMMYFLEQAILAGKEPPARQVGEIIRRTVPVEIPVAVREYIATILAPQEGQQRKVGGNRGTDLMDQISPDPRKVFARVDLEEHLKRLRAELAVLKTEGFTAREAHIRLAKKHGLRCERSGKIWGYERMKKYLKRGE